MRIWLFFSFNNETTVYLAFLVYIVIILIFSNRRIRGKLHTIVVFIFPLAISFTLWPPAFLLSIYMYCGLWIMEPKYCLYFMRYYSIFHEFHFDDKYRFSILLYFKLLIQNGRGVVAIMISE